MGHPAGVKRDFKALEHRRLRALKLLDQGLSQSDVARRLGVVPPTVSRWQRQARQQGAAALRHPGRAGRKPRLSDDDCQRLQQWLLAGPEAAGLDGPLWTCPRVAWLIEKKFGLRYHAGHIWKLLSRLGWSCQRPEGRARERDEEEIRRWVHETWPAAKKKPKKRAVRSSSSTKRG